MGNRVIVIGGGPAGMMAAIKAAECGAEVTLLEKNSRCGKKILVTGKGRCNITNTKPWGEFSTHIHPIDRFVKPAFFNFSNIDTIEFFESIGLPTTVEQGDRVFPKSMRAIDVANILQEQLIKSGVKLLLNAEVSDISVIGDNLKITYLSLEGMVNAKTLIADNVIIATGGLSYPVTGSTGDGYKFAESLNHRIIPQFPSLTALMPVNYDRSLESIELKNVGLTLFVNKDLIQMDQGDLSFTNNGIEGSLGYRVSRRAVKAMINGQKVELMIDLKPALSLDKLKARIERELASMSLSRDAVTPVKMKELLRKFMPAELISPFLKSNQDLSISNLSDKLKDWRFKISSYTGYERAVVTAGGVSTEDIVAKTMRSKINPHVFFAGEVMDVDCDTGGYNLQIAFSTGALAGISAAKSQNQR